MVDNGYRLEEPTVPLLRARCPPGMRMEEGFTKCTPMAEEALQKRLRFKEYLESSKLLETLEELTLRYVLDEGVKPKPAVSQRYFAEKMAAQMGLGGDHVENVIKDMKRETMDAYKRLAALEAAYEMELEERKRITEEEKLNEVDEPVEVATAAEVKNPADVTKPDDLLNPDNAGIPVEVDNPVDVGNTAGVDQAGGVENPAADDVDNPKLDLDNVADAANERM